MKENASGCFFSEHSVVETRPFFVISVCVNKFASFTYDTIAVLASSAVHCKTFASDTTACCIDWLICVWYFTVHDFWVILWKLELVCAIRVVIVGMSELQHQECINYQHGLSSCVCVACCDWHCGSSPSPLEWFGISCLNVCHLVSVF